MTDVDSHPAAENNNRTLSTIVAALIPRLPPFPTEQPRARPLAGIELVGHEVAWSPIAWGLVANVLRAIIRNVAPTGENGPHQIRWEEEALREEILAIAKSEDFRASYGTREFTDEFTSLMVYAMATTLVKDPAVQGTQGTFQQVTVQFSNGPCFDGTVRRCLTVRRL